MKLYTFIAHAASLGTLAGQAHAAITIDVDSATSIKRAASTAAFDMMKLYTGNRTGDVPGNLPDPYYWWECGAMFGSMLNYVFYTGDTSYNDVIMQGMIHQAGPDAVFEPVNQTKSLGNDDQAFWGLAAMTAAETKFPDPPKGTPGWLALAQGVFNRQAARWDDLNCNGGLRWQIHHLNGGYDYKNSISNGCFFNLAARLALYTGNQTYADWAEKTWTWTQQIGLIDGDFAIYDGGSVKDSCQKKDPNQWTYNNGVYTLGAAAMYNFTNAGAVWKQRVDGLLAASKRFFLEDIMYEPCEASGKCNVDQKSFKAYFTRWLAATAQLYPESHDNIMREIRTSAVAAAKTCTGGATGTQCGIRWTEGVYDTDPKGGVGEQMSALEIFQSNLVDAAPAWASIPKGTGISQGDANAGTGARSVQDKMSRPTTTADRVGAGFLTALIILGVLGGTATMMISE